MYMNFDDYPSYTDEISDNFGTKINTHIRGCHGQLY